MSLMNTNKSKAEIQFYEAFLRLKENKPINLPKNSKISQNNVAKEAGVDPSALRKSRYPNLIDEIQQWIDAHPQQNNVKKIKSKDNADQISVLKDKINLLIQQRDDAVSKLLEAQLKLVEMANDLKKINS